ncbi:hypothetical protein DFJ58DRAFT_913940 [Suillus subalutaceus]|uniref:uncharacterized protein n=1 Tax=Suillus subalutaceus TaxID=48586 RepID=UPI001B85C4A2|nr:uncharacterized protein DFJ58DRAFT_913940 [Suillus subalutaceus]KAG1854962.1 hypothetical protein DFJ58DRAFT_913940 [Suillus subalutaceus]
MSIPLHRLLHLGRTIGELTPLLPEKTQSQTNLQGGKSIAQQNQTRPVLTVTNYRPVISSASNRSASSRLKGTVAKLKYNQGFTMNISGPFVENANANAIDTPLGFDEWNSGLPKEKRVQIKTSRVKESAFSMECEYH